MKIAIIGATGLVGSTILRVLEEEKFLKLKYIDEIFLVGSQKSVGKKIKFNKRDIEVISIQDCLDKSPYIAIFSAGGEVSKQYAKKFTSKNTFVIDNSSAWRMDKDVPLVVPEINIDLISNSTKLISNPNCSTIQLVVALSQLHKKYILKRIVVSTYQSVTGTGVAGINQLNDERKNVENPSKVYPYQIDLNLIPHGGDFKENLYTTEEIKLVDETRKILGSNNIGISATVVRVPVFGGHSESVNAEFVKTFKLNDVIEVLEKTNGVKLTDDIKNNIYPMPLFAQNTDDVFVGRVRLDESCPNTVNMWIVSDNLRKGAATNAIQIAAFIIDNFLAK